MCLPPGVRSVKWHGIRRAFLFLILALTAAPQSLAQDQLSQPVTFSATDSLIIRFSKESGDRGRLIGAASVNYGDAQLEAHAITILFDLDELQASGLVTDTGTVGRPRFTQGGESFEGESMSYNMGTGRGRITQARTQFSEGFIQAGIAKVREDSTVFVQDGVYTTCNCAPGETPSYSLRAAKMKVVDQKWVYTGPIQLYIYNIPMLFWLPFGFLPYQEGRRSGLLAPEYGEDQRGFYLRNWGWYWAINDYLDLQTRFGLWTKGSWQVHPTFRYNRRDRYSGTLDFDMVRERSGEWDDPDVVIRNSIRLAWTHNQTLSPTASLTGNVNLTTSSYLQTVSDQYNDNVRQSVGSSIRYRKVFGSGRSLTINMRQNQVLSTGATDLALPELAFSQTTKTPFKRGGPARNARWYERLQYSLSSRITNRFNFRPLADAELIARGDTLADGTPVSYQWWDALFDQALYERATGREGGGIDFRALHRVPLAMPFTINRLPLIGQFRLNVSPNANYTENWYLETERRALDSTGVTRRQEVQGFFALRQFNMGVSANTTLYGLFPLETGQYRGLRHTLRPRVGFVWRPDFASPDWGYSRALYDADGFPVVDTLFSGEVEPRRYNVVTGVQTGISRSISFGIDNIFETKQIRTDSTGEEQSRVLKLFNVNVTSSYNMAADSLNLAPLRISARTNVFGKLNLNISGTFSPYGLNEAGTRKVHDYVFSLRDFRFARLIQLSMRGDVQIRGRGRAPRPGPASQVQQGMPRFDGPSSVGVGNPFSSSLGQTSMQGWTLNVSLGYRVSRPLSKLTRSATVNTRFGFSVTPTWRVQGQTGYDFERGKVVTTTLNLAKEFECWEMGFRWVPFGTFQSWGFDLHVKSGRLSEFLRLRQPKAERDRGFGRRY